MTTIGISITRILDGIYAASALRNATDERRAILSRDNSAALRRVAADAAAFCALHFAAYIASTNLTGFNPADDDIITIDFVYDITAPGLVRSVLEAAVSAAILQTAGLSVEAPEVHLQKLIEILSDTRAAPTSFMPAA